MSKPRSNSPNEEAPYLWQSKDPLYRIENSQSVRNHGSAKLVYVALTWIASDEGSSVFTVEIAAIARKASLGYRTVWDIVKKLEELELIKVNRPKLRSEATFTICTTCKTSGTGRKTICKRKQHSFADITKEHRRKKKEAPVSLSERIAKEKQLGILKGQLKELEEETAEQWQRDAHPELVKEKQKLRADIKALENSLLDV